MFKKNQYLFLTTLPGVLKSLTCITKKYAVCCYSRVDPRTFATNKKWFEISQVLVAACHKHNLLARRISQVLVSAFRRHNLLARKISQVLVRAFRRQNLLERSSHLARCWESNVPGNNLLTTRGICVSQLLWACLLGMHKTQVSEPKLQRITEHLPLLRGYSQKSRR